MVTPEARELLAQEGFDPVYGARPLKRVIQRQLQNPIALELLEGKYGEGETVAGRAGRIQVQVRAEAGRTRGR